MNAANEHPATGSKGRWAALIAGVAAAGAAIVWCSPRQAEAVVRHGGYWVLLAVFAAFAVYWARVATAWARSARKPRRLLLEVALAAAIGGAMVLLHGMFREKIAMDDYLLRATAKSLHEEREVAAVSFGRMRGNVFTPSETFVDKRPWLYPFLVATAHDFTGERRANAFAVNAAACVLFVGGAYVAGRWLAGRPGGWLSVGLWATLPLLTQNATGAGMAMVNLLMLQTVLLLAIHYARSPKADREAALVWAAVLLAYSRYESGVFLLPVGALLAWGWWRRGCLRPAWATVLAAPALIPVLLQTKIYSATQRFWELSDDASAPFGSEHLTANVPHALHFFFDPSHTLPNSLWIAVLGFPALLFFPFLFQKMDERLGGRRAAHGVFAVFLFFFLVHAAVILSFHASRLDQLYVSRYALPLHLPLVLAATAVLGAWARRGHGRAIWTGALTTTAAFFLAFTIPAKAKAIYTQRNHLVREELWLDALSENRLERRSMVIDRFTVPWGLRAWASLPPDVAALHAVRLRRERAAGEYTALYLVERSTLGPTGFEADVPAVKRLREAFATTVVAKRSFRPLERTRVHRLDAPVKPLDSLRGKNAQ